MTETEKGFLVRLTTGAKDPEYKMKKKKGVINTNHMLMMSEIR